MDESVVREIRERIRAIEAQVGLRPGPWLEFIEPKKKPTKKK